MALPSYYSTGTASITNGETVVTGASTGWTAPLRAGDLFGIHVGLAVPIASVDSDTQLTLAYVWPGATQSAAAYAVQIIPDVARMQETTRQVLQQIGEGNLQALAGLTGAAGTMPVFTGAGTMEVQDVPNIAAASDFFHGFGYARDQTDGTFIDIAAGSCRDSLNQYTINLSSSIRKQVSALWAAGAGAGGWDFTPGAVPSGFHWIHAILNPTTGATDVLFSSSINAPVMPSGFTARRLIGGFAYVQGTGVADFINRGEWHFYKSRPPSISDLNINTTPQNVLLAVPLGAKATVQATLLAYNTATEASNIIIRDPDLGTYTPDATLSSWYQAASAVIETQALLTTDTVGRVSVASTSATTHLTIYVEGWRLDRGVYR